MTDRTLPRYLLVGAAAGGLWAVLTFLLADQGVRGGVASGAAFVVCVPLAYLGHRLFTFRSNGSVLEEFPRFVGKALLGLLLTVLTPEAVRLAGGSILFAILLTPVVLGVFGFLAARHWVFRDFSGGSQ